MTTTRRALYFRVVMCLFSFAFLKNLTGTTDVTGDAGQRDRLRLLGTAWDPRMRQCPKGSAVQATVFTMFSATWDIWDSHIVRFWMRVSSSKEPGP